MENSSQRNASARLPQVGPHCQFPLRPRPNETSCLCRGLVDSCVSVRENTCALFFCTLYRRWLCDDFVCCSPEAQEVQEHVAVVSSFINCTSLFSFYNAAGEILGKLLATGTDLGVLSSSCMHRSRQTCQPIFCQLPNALLPLCIPCALHQVPLGLVNLRLF